MRSFYSKVRYNPNCVAFYTHLIEFHELMAIHLLGLVEGSKDNVLWLASLIGERSLDGVQVMGSHRHKSALSAQVLVELVLKRNEGVVSLLCELYSPQDGAGNVWSDLLRL